MSQQSVFQSRSPTDGRVLETFSIMEDGGIRDLLEDAHRAFGHRRVTSLPQRAAQLQRMGEILLRDADELGRLITTEMGKPIAEAVAEVEKCARVCRYYAERGARFLSDREVKTEAARSLVRHEPLGIILGIMPWNFPFWQVFRFAVPTLMAGNVVILKHAPSVPLCALAIEELIGEAGVEPGSFQNLFATPNQLEWVIADDRVRGVSLTGSVAAGRAVASHAGAAIKRSVLELGGSDPLIVMPSADLEAALDTAVTSRTINSGQSCIAAKRLLVSRDIYDEFVPRFTERMAALRVGDPLDRETQIGPLAGEAIRAELDRQVRETIDLGARPLVGGEPLPGPGFFYPPTVLADVPSGSPADREELFGPVASVFAVEDAGDAIRLANSTRYGLGASVWTRGAEEQQRFSEELEAGQVFVNAMVASDPRLPFGGVKDSGYGRELGREGILEFVNVKTVWIA
jgi:succinate-semialdehyde dehydrogenase/glutarate-semialdehyde dehydrogenase